jgi:hypothetical protein
MPDVSDVPTIKQFEGVFSNIVSVALGFAGVAVFIMFLIGGFKYLTSGGDPKGVEEAQKTLTYAIGGLILIALSYLILVFLSQFTGVDLTKFTITR